MPSQVPLLPFLDALLHIGLAGPESISGVALFANSRLKNDISGANKEELRLAGDFISPFRCEYLPRFFANHVFRVFRQHRDS